MGHRHSRDDLLEAAVAVAIEHGIDATTFAAVGRRAGASDRMVVYYFPTKADLLTAVLLSLGGRLQQMLEDAFGARPLPPPLLLRRSWPILATPEADAVFAVYFQVIGHASAGLEPYASLARAQTHAWVEWLQPRLVIDDPRPLRGHALAALAQLDGLLLMRQLVGAEAADAAARALGIV
jgi:AcrR family transcriptional regulator